MATTGTTNTPDRQPRLLEQVREALRLRHYSLRTERALPIGSSVSCCFAANGILGRWELRRWRLFYPGWRWKGRYRRRPRGQVLAARLFLYKQVLGVDLPWLDEIVRAKRPQHLPTALTPKQELLGQGFSISPITPVQW